MRVTSPPLTDKQKRYIRRLKGIKAPFSLDTPQPPFKRVRDFNAPVRQDFIPSKPRGKSGCRLSPAIRAKLAEKATARKAFFASIGVAV